MTEKKKEHPQAKWLRAIADGETLQKRGGMGRIDVPGNSAIEAILKYGDEDWFIKPRTITIGKYEVAEPMRVAPPHLTEYWGIQGGNATGVYGDIWSDCSFEKLRLKSGMCWLKREDAELAAKAITELLTGK